MKEKYYKNKKIAQKMLHRYDYIIYNVVLNISITKMFTLFYYFSYVKINGFIVIALIIYIPHVYLF